MSPHAVASPFAPALLGLRALTELTRRYAAEVRAGRHRVVVDPEQRWYNLLRSDDAVDVWLITWSTEQFAELHDHGDSLGALTVVRGGLTEDRWVPGRHALAGRRIGAGRSVGFGRGYVHEVSNPDAQAAVSVHAYSPPLTRMSYYAPDARSDGAGSVLRRTRTVVTGPGRPEGVG
ncbi:cysteine dioxygenase [Pseudonocardia lacus]|uniref:cysteine dioxygenase n=1 Tax=Pseudonocardia lacus TaxID=2835865 RepID=UPI001BDDB3D7|nr:cysteine dioxygenase family protein [Pseudonocardia lacus]